MVSATYPRRCLSRSHPGFTLVEVLVSLVVLAVALLGLAGVAAVAATSLTSSLARERAARHAAALLDSLVFGGVGSGSAVVDGVTYEWSAPAGAGAEIRVRARIPGRQQLVLDFAGRRIALPRGTQP